MRERKTPSDTQPAQHTYIYIYKFMLLINFHLQYIEFQHIIPYLPILNAGLGDIFMHSHFHLKSYWKIMKYPFFYVCE